MPNLREAARSLLDLLAQNPIDLRATLIAEGNLRAALAADADRVSVPSDMVLGLTAVSTQPRYAGWVFVKHVDGQNWTTGAKLTPETWGMIAAVLAAAEKEPQP